MLMVKSKHEGMTKESKASIESTNGTNDPRIVTGGSKKPSVWHRVRQRVTRSRRNKIILVALVAIALLGLSAATVWQIQTNNRDKVDKNSLEYQDLEALKGQAVPTDRREKIVYYIRLSGAYATLQQNKEALDALEKADSYLTTEDRDNGLGVNLDLASLYRLNGDKDRARQYYQKEIDRLERSPDRKDNQPIIENIKRLKQAV